MQIARLLLYIRALPLDILTAVIYGAGVGVSALFFSLYVLFTKTNTLTSTPGWSRDFTQDYDPASLY